MIIPLIAEDTVRMQGSAVLALLLSHTALVWGHGYLSIPAARNAMWRYGFNNPPNYDDNGLSCGGAGISNGDDGKNCGFCGDSYGGSRPHEAGGKYANGIITATYRTGSTIDVETTLDASHRGYIKFKICANNNPTKRVTQECFERYGLLKFANGQTTWSMGSENRKYTTKLVLPAGLTCSQCVLQWYYHASNTQERYYNCADIAISNDGGSNPPTPGPTSAPTTAPPITGPCRGTGSWEGDAGMSAWCNENCPANCPPTYCVCD